MPKYVEATQFFRCTNPRCQTRFWPIEAGPDCPLCGLGGLYAGIAVKEWDPAPEEEAERTVQPITEHEHAPPPAMEESEDGPPPRPDLGDR